MPEKKIKRVHTEQMVLDIGQDIGALIISTPSTWCGREIEVSPKGQHTRKTHTEVLEHQINGTSIFAATFPSLVEGEYTLWRNMPYPTPVGEVTIVGGEVIEIDWSGLSDLPDAFPQAYDRGELANSEMPEIHAIDVLLPPRYRAGRAVSAAPMGAASLRYSEDGQVAWDQIWSDFCDLALAGGPPHRGSLLEPVPPDEVLADLDAYGAVLAELERGLQLVTGLATVRSKHLGWVGLQCQDEQMALWLLRAIIVENICVRREDTVLFLPAGPQFQIDKEIKNVITVVAKTFHYWNEHCV